jgi:hypothetical protein
MSFLASVTCPWLLRPRGRPTGRGDPKTKCDWHGEEVGARMPWSRVPGYTYVYLKACNDLLF